MISNDQKRVKIQDVVENQLPSFVREDFPLISEFLKQYYLSQEYQGAPSDLLANIDLYLNLDILSDNGNSTTTLTNDISTFDSTIFVNRDLIYSFPDNYGLIQIGNEIILYTSKGNNSLDGCVRGFSGITSYTNKGELVFSESEASEHLSGSQVKNLSGLFLNKFLTKIKNQISPGFENRDLYNNTNTGERVNQSLFLKHVKDFYNSKGTENSFEILFRSLYNEDVSVIIPSKNLFRPSDAQYIVTKDIVVESIQGNPLDLLNRTLYQDSYQSYGIGNAYGSITSIEKISVGQKDYYRLSVDFDYSKDIILEGSVYGDFSVHPKTRVITQVSSNSSSIDVDSTIGFPNSGNLVVPYENGTTGIVTYASKTYNQFLGIIGISTLSTIEPEQEVRIDAFAYGYSGEDIVTMRVGSVLSSLNLAEDTYYYNDNDSAKIKSLGIEKSSPKTDCWLYNIQSKFDLQQAPILIDPTDFTYRVSTHISNNFRIGDNVVIRTNLAETYNSVVIDILTETTFTLSGQGNIATANRFFTVERKLKKPNLNASLLSKYQNILKYTTDVQNTYAKFNDDVLVASSSIPSTNELNFYDRILLLTGPYAEGTQIFNFPNHGYYTGDKVFYEVNPNSFSFISGLTSSSYIVQRLDENRFRLATSLANIYASYRDTNEEDRQSRFISVSSGSSNAEYFGRLIPAGFVGDSLEHQNILKEIKNPVNDGGVYPTEPGTTGILINGVEVLNYKSNDYIYHGKINSIQVASEGHDYDVINPPIINISDEVGSGATAKCAVSGSLQRIDIIDTGFDYTEIPTISINGGNGTGATAEINTSLVTHSVNFYSDIASSYISTSSNTIGFSTYHKFRNYERAIYKTDGQIGVTGLTTDSHYYVGLVDAVTLKLFETESDAISGINTVGLSSFGQGVHRLVAFNKKRIVSGVTVTNSGNNYENKEKIALPVGINTALDTINIQNHTYNSRDIVTYATTGVSITGLSTTSTYIVTKVDDDNFKLSQIGLGETAKYFYYDTNQYINLQSIGSGVHTFNYEPISISINGPIGVTTFSGSGQNFDAVIQPVFRGVVSSVQVTETGVGYGVTDIFNLDRQPVITLSSGSGAALLPIVSDGEIIEVLVISPGSGYNSPPDLNIVGQGRNAKLTPVITNGQIERVVVNRSGSGYSNSTGVNVVSAGSEAKLTANIQSWNVNLFTKKYNNILNDGDDGFLYPSNKFGIKYTHMYAPRKLRMSIYGKDFNNNIRYGNFDLTLNESGEEINSQYHSPIIGWAYDGNPIYGPFGFSRPDGGNVRLMKSGYTSASSLTDPNRPPFEEEFFIEDFIFTNDGDLDEHNGRFCITPEFPQGTYAYFSTVNVGPIENSGPFFNYKKPIFPYIIGNSFKSRPNEFNFNVNNNQVDYALNASDWFRNTKPYNLNESKAYYNYLFQPNKLKESTVNLRAYKGSLDSVNIVSGGSGYKVGDTIVFEPANRVALARVEKISGKDVNYVSAASTTFYNVEITRSNPGEYIAFTEVPHSFINGDIVYVSGLSTSTRNLQRNFVVGISSETYELTSDVDNDTVTGIVTYFNIRGNLNYPSLRVDDILQIESEKVKVLSIDNLNSRIRVLRAQDGTSGVAHTSTTTLTELTKKLTFASIPENIAFNQNKKIYFNPEETVGVGTTSGVGVGVTLSFANPGAGATEVFIPTRSLYIPNHGLNTGERVVYSFNQGSSIAISATGIGSTTLDNDSSLYVAKINNDIIGLSTVKVGLGSTGTFVGIASTTSNLGLLYFTGIGTGVYHSLETTRESVISEVSKNLVSVSLAATHGLSLGDRFELSLKPVTTFTVVVKYNDYNRRIVFNPKSFVSGDVDTIKNTIYIQDHNYADGDKVIHSSTSPCGGLVDEKIYYVIRYSVDKIRLSETYNGSIQTNKEFVDISSSSFGTISPINPKITGYKNSKIRFDTSDSSLSYISGTTYSAFKLNFYTDSSFTTVFESSKSTDTFEVTRFGNIGFNGSYVDLTISDFLPEELYYRFIPVNGASLVKSQIVVDEEVFNNNKIVIKNSEYHGNHVVAGIGTTTFNFNLNYYPEKSSYNTQEASIEYKTTSITDSGSIAEINIIDSGFGYDYVPGVSTIRTASGNSAILESQSRNIGSISSYAIENIGFDYPSDNTLRPICNLPEILKIEPLSSFEEIGITSSGRNYLTAPNLVVIDGFTNRVIRDVDLRYRLGDNRVTILTNTYGIYNTTPRIIPTNNTNGVGISSILYNSSSQNVTVYLNAGFSDSFPFSVGDRVLIENVSVGVASTGYGYNSSNYEYTLFTLTGVHPGLGGNVGVVTYSLSDYLPVGRTPGSYDSVNSSGRIIPEKDFPIFRTTLRKNNFIIGETVKSSSNQGVVESWNNDIDILKVSTEKDFSIGEVVVGQTSRTQGLVSRKYDFNADFSTSSSSIVKKGWESDAGFLNSNTERISDNFYYQKFSYSLKSRVPLQDWNDPVSSLNHTAGYLKFSDLNIESENTLLPIFGDRYNNLGSTDVIVDLYRESDLDCYSSYDYATENSLNLNSRQASDEIYFRNSILTDYFESIGNRVLRIDDVSGEFNSNERVTRYSIVDRFSLESTYKKYFILAQDTVFSDERQISIVSLLQDGSLSYISQYGRVESQLDLGYYDFSIFGSEGNLRFYPTKYQANNYNVTNVSFDINGIAGVGTTSLGDVVNVSTANTSVSIGTTTTIVSIADTYRSSKVLVQVKTTDDQYQVNEINLLHNGSEVYALDYGQINSTPDLNLSGLGTYNAYISGNNVILDFIPSTSVASTTSAIIVSIASTLSTGIGTETLSFGANNLSTLESNYVSISSSPTPTNNIIAEYSNENSGAYLIVSIEDTTNNNYEMLELIVVNDSTNTYLTQYGALASNSGIGTFGSSLVGSDVQIYFTPLPDIDVQIRSFELDLRISGTNGSSTEQSIIDLESGEIRSNYGYYFGTLTDVKRQFELTHNNREIFERLFDASDSEIISIADDTITIPEHFFVTGEEVVYVWPGAGTTASIGIGTTTFAGIGQTDKLPSSVFVIKVDDTKIKLARSAEDALNGVPISVDLLSVGVGTGHTITSINQNSKCILAIDNVIQSPIVSTATTTLLSSYLEISNFVLEFDDINSFFGNDLIKIDNEIMKIKTVGFGSTNRVLVDRPWMGTGISTHSSGSLITKIEGQYNIIDNTVHFVSAPYGNIPIGSTTNPPDERDWTGITTSSKFQGRVFLRSGQPNTSSETYSKNYVFDDISEQFNAITKDFILKVDNQNITGISDNNAVILINSIFQSPSASFVVRQDYDLQETSGITSIRFTGAASSVAYDPNNASIPVGGIIVSVASTEGFGYQPLVAAGGTAIVSVAGTISSISIGNSGSGYRVGIQTIVNVGVYTSSTGTPNIEFIGTAAVSNGNIVSVAITNPGTGYTSTNPPNVVFDSPLNYSNIPLIYSSSSSGVGTEATVDVIVGQGSSVIDFELKYTGYNYQVGDILTFAAGGTSGIPTDTTKPFTEFQITVDTVESDKFSGWHLGQLEVFDSIESLFDGQRRIFPLSKDGSPISIRVSPGSNIDIQSTLLVFLNDILQVPGEGYTYRGGSVISFPEAPKGPSLESGDPTSSDRCTILFYKGSGDIDVIFRDVLETVKVGDTLTINDDNFVCSNMIQQDERIVTEILSSDSVETNTYFGPGINGNPDCYRTVDWCKQKNDLVIDGSIVSKSRTYYEPIINPVSYLIQPVGVGSTIVYVDSIRPFFNQNNENSTLQNSVTFIPQEQIVGASATSLVSVAGTVSSISITNGGSGYTSVPNVSIQVGFGTTQPATAVASVTAGIVTTISVTGPGTGYTSTNPPVVLIEPPSISVETNSVSQYFGDYGKVVGFGFTTSSGISTITFDLWIEEDSFVRDSALVGTAVTISGISTGDYILINDSNIGLANTSITSLRIDSSSIGIGSQFISNVYQVITSTEIQKYIIGIGTTYVNRIEVKVSGMGTDTLDSFDSSTRDYIYSGGITTATHFGSYSWGKIHLNSRTGLGSFGFYGDGGVGGIVTSTLVRRTNSLKYTGYL